MFTKRPVEKVIAQSALNQQVEQFEKKLVEQQRKDKEQRQTEQIKMQVQLRDFEVQLQQQQRRDYEFQQRESEQIQQQVREYQQKVQQGLVAGLVEAQSVGLVGGVEQQQQQIRDYERMLVEKLQQEVDKRQRVHMHLQQKVKEFEKLLGEQQQNEFQHLIRNQEKLRQIGLNGACVNGSLLLSSNGIENGICGQQQQPGLWQEKQQILEQQTQEEKQLKQKQEKLQKMVKEIESELNLRDIDQQKREVTGHLRAQEQQHQIQQAQQQQVLGSLLAQSPIQQQQPFGLVPSRIEQVQLLEQQLQEYKRILREKYQQQQVLGAVAGGLPCVSGLYNRPLQQQQWTVQQQQQIQECLTNEWIKTLVQKLKELEIQLVQQGTSCYAEKKLNQLRNHIAFFDQVEPVQQFYPCQQQMLRLKEFLDYELPVEIKQQWVGTQGITLRQLCQEIAQSVEEKVRFVAQQLQFAEQQPITGTYLPTLAMPVDRLWSNLKSIEFQLRDLRQGGEYEPYWQQLHKKIFQLEQYVQQQQQQQQYLNGAVAFGIEQGPITYVQQKMENIQDQIQQLESIVQDTLCIQRQVPLKVQVVKHQLQKHLIKRLVQVIEDVEAQVQEIKIQNPVASIQLQQQPMHYQIQMALRHLKGLKTQLRCLQQQQNLVLMQQRLQQLAFDYERQLPVSIVENKQHQIQLQQVMQTLKCLEQQLIEQQIQVYQQQQQWTGCSVGLGAEEIFEQVKQQFLCQKQLQQAIKEFAYILVQQKQIIPTQVRIQTQQALLQQLREFENILVQCNEVVADQTQLIQFNGVTGQIYSPQQQQQQLHGLLRQMQQLLTQIQTQTIPEQFQFVPLSQHQRLVNGLQQQIQQVQLQLQQHYQYQQQYPQLSWIMEQQQRQCIKRLQQSVQQLQQLQQFQQQPDVLQCQQQHILLQQAQQNLQQLYFIHQQHQKPQFLKNWQSAQQVQLVQLQQNLQQLKQQVGQIRLLQQQLRLQQECLPFQRVGGAYLQQFTMPYVPMRPFQQQLVKSISQPFLHSLEQQQFEIEQQQQIESILQDQINNNCTSLIIDPTVEGVCLEDIYGPFLTMKQEVEQENYVADLIQKYTTCLSIPTEYNQEYRRKIEQLYFENTKLSQLVRRRINEIAHLKKQFEELQYLRIGKPIQYQQGGLRVAQPTFGYRSVYPGSVVGIPSIVEYETCSSLPVASTTSTTTTTTTVGDELIPVQQQVQEIVQQQQYQYQKPSFKCVEQLINQLENKLAQLRVEGQQQLVDIDQETTTGGLYPSTIRRALNGLQEPIVQYRQQQQQIQQQQTTFNGSTIGQQTVVEITKKQQTPGQQVQTQTQIMQEFKICPVCGIAVEKELSQPEFELHVNSHFPFTD